MRVVLRVGVVVVVVVNNEAYYQVDDSGANCRRDIKRIRVEVHSVVSCAGINLQDKESWFLIFKRTLVSECKRRLVSKFKRTFLNLSVCWILPIKAIILKNT